MGNDPAIEFPVVERLRELLKQYWGYDRFLPLQEPAMASVLAGWDSIVVLPTGGGKSLCFQAPAVAMEGLAIVISPLIALMKDQVDALTEYGIPAGCLNSAQSPDERRMVTRQLDTGCLKLLYVAPERLLMSGFIDYLKQFRISFVAVDEAHCISIWGHDFRPEYRKLRVLKEIFPGVAIHAYTATATDQVRSDIARELQLTDPEVLVGSFDRPNLVYRVKRRTPGLAQICEVIDRHKGESGIIYCIRRLDVEETCADLKARGYRALPYHAGMEDDARKKNQEMFIQEETDIIVATIAFGMGIDKSNVRYVIHAAMPKSLEHYQQESGRAGRDGLEAECCLFYSPGDFAVWDRILANSEVKGADIALAKLNHMYNFCTGVTCRHQAIVGYFGQTLDKPGCDACDVCLGDVSLVPDRLVIAQKIISNVLRLRESFGGDYNALVLTGSAEERIVNNGHDALSTYGLLKNYTKRIVRDWIEQLAAQGYLRKVGEFNVLAATEKGWAVLKGKETPRLLKPAEKAAPKVAKIARDSWEGVDETLFEKLRNLRRTLAAERGVPAYVIFTDTALRDMARRRPATPEAFLAVNGVGQRKCAQFGDLFIRAIREYNKE